jgi:hypothetical protein
MSSLLWATVALVVLLLPGFAFFAGLQIPEKFTRDSPTSSPWRNWPGLFLYR